MINDIFVAMVSCYILVGPAIQNMGIIHFEPFVSSHLGDLDCLDVVVILEIIIVISIC